MEEKWIKFKHKVDDIKHKVEDKSLSTFDKIKNKVKGIYSKWQNNSKKVMDGYIGQFDKRDGRAKRQKNVELESMPSASQIEDSESVESDSSLSES